MKITKGNVVRLNMGVLIGAAACRIGDVIAWSCPELVFNIWCVCVGVYAGGMISALVYVYYIKDSK